MMKEDDAQAERAGKAIRWLYLLMAVGIFLPLFLFFLFA